MKRVNVTLIVLALVAVGLGGHLLQRRLAAVTGDAKDPAAPVAVRESSGRAGDEYRGPGGSAPGREPTAGSSRLIRIGDPMYGVRTQAEADWLNRNRFPRIEPGIPRAPAATDLQGPLTADAIWRAEAVAMLMPELREHAMERLGRAAEDGSIAALHALSRAYQHRKRDLLMAEAYARAAELRGDWNPVIRMYDLDPLQAMAAPILAHRILHDIDRARRTRGLPPLVRDERPGLVEVSDRMLQAHRAGELKLPAPPRP